MSSPRESSGVVPRSASRRMVRLSVPPGPTAVASRRGSASTSARTASVFIELPRKSVLIPAAASTPVGSDCSSAWTVNSSPAVERARAEGDVMPLSSSSESPAAYPAPTDSVWTSSPAPLRTSSPRPAGQAHLPGAVHAAGVDLVLRAGVEARYGGRGRAGQRGGVRSRGDGRQEVEVVPGVRLDVEHSVGDRGRQARDGVQAGGDVPDVVGAGSTLTAWRVAVPPASSRTRT